MERNPDGTLRPGHGGLKKKKARPISEAQQLKLHNQELTFLTHNQEVALKREAIHQVIGEHEIKQAILDIYNSARAAENPYTKKALYELFFMQVMGTPPKQVEVQSTSHVYKQSIDYSKLTKDELSQLESIATKVVPTEENALT
jgi:galactose-1-phosphate uridylyltransferase